MAAMLGLIMESIVLCPVWCSGGHLLYLWWFTATEWRCSEVCLFERSDPSYLWYFPVGLSSHDVVSSVRVFMIIVKIVEEAVCWIDSDPTMWGLHFRRILLRISRIHRIRKGESPRFKPVVRWRCSEESLARNVSSRQDRKISIVDWKRAVNRLAPSPTRRYVHSQSSRLSLG